MIFVRGSIPAGTYRGNSFWMCLRIFRKHSRFPQASYVPVIAFWSSSLLPSKTLEQYAACPATVVQCRLLGVNGARFVLSGGNTNVGSQSIQVSRPSTNVVPEPPTLLLGTGLVRLLVRKRWS